VIADPGLIGGGRRLDDSELRSDDFLSRMGRVARAAVGPQDAHPDADEDRVQAVSKLAAALAHRVHSEAALLLASPGQADRRGIDRPSIASRGAGRPSQKVRSGLNKRESGTPEADTGGALDEARENWAVFAAEFEATSQRVLRSLRLTRGREPAHTDAVSLSPGARHSSSEERPPLPEPWMRPWLNAIGILSLVWIWAGFVGMMLGLYLLSAEVWAEQSNSEWSIALLIGIGFAMMVLGTTSFIHSRRGWPLIALYALVPAVLLQVTGGVVMGVFSLPFALEAAAAVFGLQVLPALIVLCGYFVFEWYRGAFRIAGTE